MTDNDTERLPAYLTRRTEEDRRALLAAWEAQTRWLYGPEEDNSSEPPEQSPPQQRPQIDSVQARPLGDAVAPKEENGSSVEATAKQPIAEDDKVGVASVITLATSFHRRARDGDGENPPPGKQVR